MEMTQEELAVIKGLAANVLMRHVKEVPPEIEGEASTKDLNDYGKGYRDGLMEWMAVLSALPGDKKPSKLMSEITEKVLRTHEGE